MQTLKDLQKIGFHGKNFVKVELPSFFYDSEKKKIVKFKKDLNSNSLVPCVVKSIKLFNNLDENMELEWFRKIYNAKLVAWHPAVQPPETDEIQYVLLRFCILEE